jgi:hypothetical protein
VGLASVLVGRLDAVGRLAFLDDLLEIRDVLGIVHVVVRPTGMDVCFATANGMVGV